jgi:Mrp family chromosome partitioning ATPase
MEHELAGVSGKSIAVTSARMGGTRTSTAMQIASAASYQNRKVLLIDADVRTRHLSKRVDAAQLAAERDAHRRPASSGKNTSTQEYIDRLVLTDGGMVLPVASDPTDPWNPEASYRVVDVPHIVRTLGEMFDLVLIDTPPLLASSNAVGVAGQADGVVLIVSHRIPLMYLREVRDRLAVVKSPLIGYVYVRPHGRRMRTLWERVSRPLRRTQMG